MTESKHQCIQKQSFLSVDKNMFLNNCLLVETDDNSGVDNETQGITLIFKMNTSRSCLDSVEVKVSNKLFFYPT